MNAYGAVRPRRWWALALYAALVGCSAERLQSAHAAPLAKTAAASPRAPRAERRPHVVRSPAGERQDEYYWLRDDTRSAPDVLAYARAENAYTDAMLAPLAAERRELYQELVTRIAQRDESVPVHEHGYLYFTRWVEGADYPLYLRRADGEGAEEQLLLDGNHLARGYGFFDIAAHEVSSDGTLLAWAEDRVGRGQHVIRIKNLRTGQLYADTIVNAEPFLAWANDHRTLLYIEKDPETLLGTRVKRHVLGSPVAQDALVYEERDHAFYLALWKSRSGRFLHVYAQATESSEQWVADADDPNVVLRPLLPRAAKHEYLAEDWADRWLVRTNRGADNFRVVEVTSDTLATPERWREWVAAPRNGLLEDLTVFRDFFVYRTRVRAQVELWLQRFDGSPAERIPLGPAPYSAQLTDNPVADAQMVRLEHSSLVSPPRIYDYDVTQRQLTLRKEQPVLGGYQAADYVTQALTVTARDGASVPVSLAHQRDLKQDGSGALYMLAYGAYGASEDPEFSSARISLMKRGVVLAVAHVRGGQELGRAWYDAGRLQHKRNTFHDFIDVTRGLVARGYAHPARVAARGASAGGLLMGAVANMAPELYRVMVAHVPFVDVVTTMLDESIPLTSNEYDEWGNPARLADYQTMLSYSPYDNVRAQPYPALFVTTSLWDSQVQFYEPLKWVARLRTHNTAQRPMLLRVNMAGSHGGRSGRFTRLAELADEYAFVLRELGLLPQREGRTQAR